MANAKRKHRQRAEKRAERQDPHHRRTQAHTDSAVPAATDELNRLLDEEEKDFTKSPPKPGNTSYA